MSSHLMTPLDTYRLTPDLIAAAVNAVAHYAVDETEARTFCQQLGLLPTEPAHPEGRDEWGRAVRRTL